MTGESSRNHSSEERQGFIYDDPNTPPEQEQEYDPDYVPEREFVLMPLFRRIGDMLGLRRKSEDGEHVLPHQQVTPPALLAEPEDVSTSAARLLDTHELLSPVMYSEVETPARPESDVLGIENEFLPEPTRSEEPEPIVADVQEPVAEPVMAAQELRAEPGSAIVHHEQEPEPTVARIAKESLVASDENRTAPPVELVATRETRPQPAPRPVLTQEDVAQLIAPIADAAREAAVKISAAVSQAAEWLHSKEEEVLRRAELPLESKRADVSQAPPVSAPKWESDQAPELQREAAWLEGGGIPVTRAKEVRPAERRPIVLKPKRPALWQRIDWAHEFTPKRVAVLGGVAMAMLMVVGVSLARRPASSVLPQQETHVIQPGGVTLTTHPRTITPAATPAAPQAKPTPQRQAAAPSRSSRQAAYDDGPDVVTHYYNKQKPSPAHQSTTVAGVKHYSDM